MNKAPAFQFFPKDWLDFRVQRMSLEAQGAYLKVLCFMWSDSDDQCSIIDNNALLARAIGTTVEHWVELRAEIQCAFDPILEEKSGHLISARLKHEALKQRKYRKLQSEKGEKSAQQRLNRGSTTGEPVYQPKSNSSSSSSEFKKEDKRAVPHSAGTADRRKRKLELSDEQFIAALKTNSAYRQLDIDLELGKIDAWLISPRGRGKKKTRQRIINWLNTAVDEQRELETAPRPQRTCIWKLSNGDTRHPKLCRKPISTAHGIESSHCDEHLAKHVEQRRHIDAQLNRVTA